MAIVLNVSGLRKSYGARTLFENLSFSIADGDRVGLIGPNGGGKTTLIEILAGREVPDAGERALRKQTRMAYVPQDSLFGQEDTVGSVLRAAVNGLLLLEDEKTARVQRMLGRAGFDDVSTAAAALSGGWKKRLPHSLSKPERRVASPFPTERASSVLSAAAPSQRGTASEAP